MSHLLLESKVAGSAPSLWFFENNDSGILSIEFGSDKGLCKLAVSIQQLYDIHSRYIQTKNSLVEKNNLFPPLFILLLF